MRTKPVLEAAPSAAATSESCHNSKWAEFAALYRMTSAAANLPLNEESAVRAIRLPTVVQESAALRFSLTCGIAEREIVRLENSMDTWRDNACRTATVGCG